MLITDCVTSQANHMFNLIIFPCEFRSMLANSIILFIYVKFFLSKFVFVIFVKVY